MAKQMLLVYLCSSFFCCSSMFISLTRWISIYGLTLPVYCVLFLFYIIILCLFICLRGILLQTRYIPSECWNLGTFYCLNAKSKGKEQIKIESAISTQIENGVPIALAGWAECVFVWVSGGFKVVDIFIGIEKSMVPNCTTPLSSLSLHLLFNSLLSLPLYFSFLLSFVFPISLVFSHAHIAHLVFSPSLAVISFLRFCLFVCNPIDKHWNLFGRLSTKMFVIYICVHSE